MYNKLCLLALAVAAQATPDFPRAHQYQGHHHQGHHHHHPSGGIFPPSGSVAGPVAPFPTGAPGPGVFPTGTAAAGGSTGGAGPQPTGDTTLTYTITANGQPTTITTTVHHTKYHTDFVYGQQAQQSEAAAANNAEQGDVTQTVHITSTSTHFITEYAGASSAPAAEEKEALPASAAGNGGCGAQSTVTIQGPEVTVTITAPAEAAGTGGGDEGMPSSQAAGASATGGGEVPPYPIPSSKKHKTKCASTGFITKGGPRPTGSGGIKHPFPMASGTAPIEKVRKLKN